MAEVENKVLLKESLSTSISATNGEVTKEVVKEEKVIAKPISKSKKSPVSKIAETFIKDDLKNVGIYVLQDVVVPAIADTLCTMFQEAAERIFHGGDDYSYSSGSSKRGGYTSYSSISSKRGYSGRKPIDSINKRSRGEIEDPIFTYREDAIKVKDELWDRLGMYGQVSISSLKRIIGDDSRSYLDNDWGWLEDQADDFEVRKIREGYLLRLPKTVYLKD